MPWFSRTPTLLVLFASLLPATALAQSTTPPSTPGSAPPSPDAGSAPVPAPAAPNPATGTSPTTSEPPPAPIDRGSLLPPSSPRSPTSPLPTPTEPRDADRRPEPTIGANPKTVYAEDWWVHSRPAFEIHGYLRVRAELFHGFALGRLDSPDLALWPQPPDNEYNEPTGSHQVRLCGPTNLAPCQDKSQAGANMRFRMNPELHVSDNLRILSQIDMLDNLVLGSTPGGYASPLGVGPGGPAGNPASPYVPIGGVAQTQVEPTAGFNSFKNSVVLKRAWGEYATPVGQLRFGRQPNHWGLGMNHNSGDSYDSDWQSTVDRIMFTTGIKSLDLYFSGAWDFPNEGPISADRSSTVGGQPYDLAQLDDVNQYTAIVARRRNPELSKLDLARGDLVINGGVYFSYRDQILAAEQVPLGTTAGQIGARTENNPYVRRGLRQFSPDLWFQLLYKKFRLEAEGVMIAGSMQSALASGGGESFNIRQFGVASQMEWKAVEDRLRLQFGFGWASGDSGVLPEDGRRTSTLSPARSGSQGTLSQRVGGSNTYTQFRFNPDYRIDLILHRQILGRVQGDYYFRPSVDYDFSRSSEGQKFGGGAAVIWTRASEYVQTPGHKRDLGIELDLSVYYQSKDGSFNDNPARMGGFFTMIQYGVLFPLGGLGFLPAEQNASDTTIAHTVRWFMGILY